MTEAMEKQGLESAGDPREIYLTDPEEEPGMRKHVTRIVWPATG